MAMYLKSRCPHWGKKITLLALLLILSWQTNVWASEIKEPETFKRHEIKLDVAYLLYGGAKVEYEFLLTPWSSIGAVGLIDLNSGYRYYKTQALGLYRLYFGKKPNTGLFIEGNIGVTTGSYDDYYWAWDRKENYTAFSVGIALGWKFYIPHPQSSVVLDIFVGAGRLFPEDYYKIYPRVGICIGMRF